MILTNAVLAKSACQSLIQFADRLFSAIYIIEDCNIHKNPRLYLQLIANHLGFLFEAEFFQPHYFFTLSVNYTINLYIFVTDLIDNHILFPYRIFIICPKADPFGEIRLHSRKHLKIFKLIINLFYRLRSIFLVVFVNLIPNILQIPPHDGQHPTIQLYAFFT